MKQNAWHTPQPDVLYYLELADHLKCGADFLLHFKFHTFASFFYAVYKEAAKNNVAFDDDTCFFHLLVQHGIANYF